jgi:hypothetical protein
MPNNTGSSGNNPFIYQKARGRLRHLFAMRDRAAEACADLEHSRRDLQERRVRKSEIAAAQEDMLAAADALDEIVEYLDDEITRELAR